MKLKLIHIYYSTIINIIIIIIIIIVINQYYIFYKLTSVSKKYVKSYIFRLF